MSKISAKSISTLKVNLSSRIVKRKSDISHVACQSHHNPSLLSASAFVPRPRTTPERDLPHVRSRHQSRDAEGARQTAAGMTSPHALGRSWIARKILICRPAGAPADLRRVRNTRSAAAFPSPSNPYPHSLPSGGNLLRAHSAVSTLASFPTCSRPHPPQGRSSSSGSRLSASLG